MQGLGQEKGEFPGEPPGPLLEASSYPEASGSAEYEQEGRERELEVTVVLWRLSRPETTGDPAL